VQGTGLTIRSIADSNLFASFSDCNLFAFLHWQVIQTVFHDFEGGSGLKIGLGLNQHLLMQQSEGNFSYASESGHSKSGQELIDGIMSFWHDSEIISLDFPVSDLDISSLRYLKKVF
jgi:hypothetical protein